jgi:CRP-like cAMP-binding protein
MAMILTTLFSSGRRTSDAQLAHVLRGVPLFRDLPAADLLAIWRRLQEVRAPAGTLICERGDPGDRFYVVQAGTLEIRLGLGPAGLVVRHIQSGDFVGEAALLTGAPRSADVIVVEDAVLWMLTRQDFEAVLAGSVSLVRAFNRALCERVAQLTQILEERGAGMGRAVAGMRFGAYRVVQQVGAGGMAVVYSAVHVESGRAVALKLLPLGWGAAPELRARLVREAAALQAVDHPHVVKVLDVGEVDARLGGGYFLAMEWLPHALDRILRAQYPAPLPPSQALRLTQQVAEGLQAVHAAGFVHRDVKPSNIMLRADGTPVLTDFGLAGVTTEGAADARLTATNVFMGTADYLAPEVVQSTDVAPTSDLYALGVVLYEMLAGHVPFAGRTPLDVLRAHVEEEPPPLPPEVPDAARTVVERALRKRPEARHASAAEMAHALAVARAEFDP